MQCSRGCAASDVGIQEEKQFWTEDEDSPTLSFLIYYFIISSECIQEFLEFFQTDFDILKTLLLKFLPFLFCCKTIFKIPNATKGPNKIK